MTRLVSGLALSLLAAAAPAFGPQGGLPRLQLSINALSSLHAQLRAGFPQVGQSESDRTALPALLHQGVSGYREIYGGLTDNPRLVMLTDSVVFSAFDLESLRYRLQRLPESLQQALPEILQILETSMGSYQEQVWPGDRQSLQERLAWWRDETESRLPALLGFIQDLLSFSPDVGQVTILVVPEAPGKGAATYRSAQGPFVVIGAGNFQGPDFVEALLHEVIHAMEVLAPEGNVLSRLRELLTQYQVDSTTMRDLTHTVIFVAAALAVQRSYDADHVALGESRGAYSRGLETYRQVVEPALRAAAAGQLDTKALLERLVQDYQGGPAADDTTTAESAGT